jgi:hypothetical protein
MSKVEDSVHTLATRLQIAVEALGRKSISVARTALAQIWNHRNYENIDTIWKSVCMPRDGKH